MEGYLHPLYSKSFSDIGTPLYLPKSKGWLIKREIPGTEYYDAMGPYPLFICENWEYLIEDISSLENDLVAVSFVIGPLQLFSKNIFQEYFEVLYEYRNHYILDTTLPFEKVISPGRRKTAQRALNKVEADYQIAPNICLDDWCHLYDNIISKYKVSGIRAFSKESFRKQIAIPKTHFFYVMYQSELVGGALFFLQNDTSYYHLSALTEKGYDLQAGYAVVWSAIKVLSNKIRWIELQGGINLNNGVIDGLSKFKMGWASFEKKSYFCGKVLDSHKYSNIMKIQNIPTTNWFPAYRIGEFT